MKTVSVEQHFFRGPRVQNLKEIFFVTRSVAHAVFFSRNSGSVISRVVARLDKAFDEF